MTQGINNKIVLMVPHSGVWWWHRIPRDSSPDQIRLVRGLPDGPLVEVVYRITGETTDRGEVIYREV